MKVFAHAFIGCRIRIQWKWVSDEESSRTLVVLYSPFFGIGLSKFSNKPNFCKVYSNNREVVTKEYRADGVWTCWCWWGMRDRRLREPLHKHEGVVRAALRGS